MSKPSHRYSTSPAMSGPHSDLLRWTQKITTGYKGVNITNFQKSWADGLAFCAMVHYFRPDLLNFDDLKPDSHLLNMKAAFDALSKMGVPQLLDAEDTVVIQDRKSIITYVMTIYKHVKDLKPEENSAPPPAITASLTPPVPHRVPQRAHTQEATSSVVSSEVSASNANTSVRPVSPRNALTPSQQLRQQQQNLNQIQAQNQLQAYNQAQAQLQIRKPTESISPRPTSPTVSPVISPTLSPSTSSTNIPTVTNIATAIATQPQLQPQPQPPKANLLSSEKPHHRQLTRSPVNRNREVQHHAKPSSQWETTEFTLTIPPPAQLGGTEETTESKDTSMTRSATVGHHVAISTAPKHPHDISISPPMTMTHHRSSSQSHPKSSMIHSNHPPPSSAVRLAQVPNPTTSPGATSPAISPRNDEVQFESVTTLTLPVRENRSSSLPHPNRTALTKPIDNEEGKKAQKAQGGVGTQGQLEQRMTLEGLQDKEEEEKRLAEERRTAEERRMAEERKIVEEKRNAEEKRITELKRMASEKRIAELKRLAEEKRIAQEKKVAEENKAAEDRKLAEEKRIAEERRTADEKRREEERKLAEEKRIAEEKKREEERRLVEEKRIAEERRIAEQKRITEQRVAEEKRIAEERRLAEEKRIAEERRLAEGKRIEDERKIAEEKKLSEERRIAEERRLMEEKKAEERRLETIEQEKRKREEQINEEKRKLEEARRQREKKREEERDHPEKSQQDEQGNQKRDLTIAQNEPSNETKKRKNTPPEPSQTKETSNSPRPTLKPLDSKSQLQSSSPKPTTVEPSSPISQEQQDKRLVSPQPPNPEKHRKGSFKEDIVPETQKPPSRTPSYKDLKHSDDHADPSPKQKPEILTGPFSPSTEVPDTTPHSIQYKIVIVGDSGVGKTVAIHRWMKDEFIPNTKATLNVEWRAKNFQVGEKVVKVEIWDTAGQERYRSLSRQFYRGASGAVIMYDVTSVDSFKDVQYWIDVLRSENSEKLQFLLIGNKIDLEEKRMVFTKEGLSFAKKNGLSFLETSVLHGSNCQKALQTILTDIHQIHQENTNDFILNSTNTEMDNKPLSSGSTKIRIKPQQPPPETPKTPSKHKTSNPSKCPC